MCRGVENHSRVAECTRLILSVGCAWGSQGMLDLEAKEHGSTQGFRVVRAERNTLRPLCDVLPELVCKLGEELCLSLHV